MVTKKLLVAFDPKKSDCSSSNLLVVVLDGVEAILVGVKSKKPVTSGLLVYVGKDIKVNDLFAKLVDAGWKIDGVNQTLRVLERYIAELQEYRIGNIIGIESDPIKGFKLIKLADAPSIPSSKNIP